MLHNTPCQFSSTYLTCVSVSSDESQLRGLGRQNASDPAQNAEVAHLVEHQPSKLRVAGSSPVFRSKIHSSTEWIFFIKPRFGKYPGGGIGRHAGLKILFAAMRVWVQLPSRVLDGSLNSDIGAFFMVGVRDSNQLTETPTNVRRFQLT